MLIRHTVVAVVLLAPAVAPAQAPQAPDPGVGMTIYSHADPASFDPQQFIAQQRLGMDPGFASQVPGFGVVRDTRRLDLEQGVNVVPFTDVAQFIDPTTVSLVDLSGQAQVVSVLEQSFQFDLVSPEKLFEKYLDQQITVNVSRGDGQVDPVSGKLLSAQQGRLTLLTDEGLRVVAQGNDVKLGALPAGLVTRPTLQWRLNVPAAGPRTVRTTYQTSGVTWRSDYNLVLNADDTQADLGAWVTILNLSGATYADATLKLIAGDVQRIEPPQPKVGMMKARAAVMMEADAAGFEEKSFFEYHLYTLPRKVTIAQNSTQQIALFPTVQGVSVEKVLVYYGLPEHARHWFFPSPQIDRGLGQQSSKKVDVYIRFDNKQENKLGIPLPKGKVRVFKLDPTDQSLEFVGEDLIDHTARNEQVLIKTGESFDVTGERVQTNFLIDNNRKTMEETYRITVKNAKNVPQKVVIRENLFRWTTWEIVRHTEPFAKMDSRTIHFDVQVPAEGSKAVEYTVKYTW